MPEPDLAATCLRKWIYTPLLRRRHSFNVTRSASDECGLLPEAVSQRRRVTGSTSAKAATCPHSLKRPVWTTNQRLTAKHR